MGSSRIKEVFLRFLWLEVAVSELPFKGALKIGIFQNI